MKKFIMFSLLSGLTSLSVIGQGTLKSALAQIKAEKSYETLVYYGVDFSHVLINDEPKIPRSVQYSEVYPPAWIAFVEENLPPDGYVRKALRFPVFEYRQQEIYEQSVKPNPQFITGHDNDIPPETLQATVSHYTLEEKSGLGLVLIPETFSKPRETATTWVVFFDIGSREILYKTRIFGKCSHMGYTAHWASGVVDGFKRFASH